MSTISLLQLPKTRNRLARITYFDVVRVVLGLILLVAASLKVYQLATEPVIGKSLLTSRWFLIAEVELELALGVFLLA